MQRTVAAAQEAGYQRILVVVGEQVEAIRTDLEGTSAEILVNDEWPEGIASSIRAGVKSASDAPAILLLACDQPRVDAAILQELLALRATTGKAIVACAYAGTVGIPAIFDRSLFGELLALTGDRGAKALIQSRPDDLATLDFPAGAIDLDTPADYARLLAAEKLPEGLEDSAR